MIYTNNAECEIIFLRSSLFNRTGRKIANLLQVGNKFIGYKAVHNYRADNNAGNTLIGNTIFFIDKNFEEITYSMEVDEYNQVQEAISSFKEQIEEEGE